MPKPTCCSIARETNNMESITSINKHQKIEKSPTCILTPECLKYDQCFFIYDLLKAIIKITIL